VRGVCVCLACACVCVCVCAVFVCASLQPLIHQLSNSTTGELMFYGLEQSMSSVGVPECRPSAGSITRHSNIAIERINEVLNRNVVKYFHFKKSDTNYICTIPKMRFTQRLPFHA
jgi:hypothetical protein